MRHEIRTEIEVHATAERVWRVLTDSAALPSWNPVITRIDGPLEVGARTRVDVAVRGRRLPLRVRLTVVRPDEALEWTGGVKGLFVARHGFRIEPLDNGHVRFAHYEIFDGFATRALRGVLSGLEADYNRMNEALKAYAEATVVDGRPPA
jgi:hypothetical protein